LAHFQELRVSYYEDLEEQGTLKEEEEGDVPL